MNNFLSHIVLLGPQGDRPNLPEVVASFNLADDLVVTITAGWQEREAEDQELDKHLEYGAEVPSRRS